MQILIGILIGVAGGFFASILALHYWGILKAPRPKVILGDRTNLTVAESEEASPEDINRELGGIEQKVPPYTASTGIEGTGLSPIAMAMKQTALQVPSRDEINRYERDRTKYLEDYKEYIALRERIRYAKTSLIIVLDICIKNKRNNVEGLTVDIHLPDDVKVLTEEQYEYELEEPEEPAQPRTTQDILFRGLDIPSQLRSYPLSMPMPGPHKNVSSFKITESDSSDVQFEVDHIEHHSTEQCGLLCVLFPSYEDIPNKYTFEWKLKAANIPKKYRKGKLAVKPIKVKKQEKSE